MHQRNHAYHRPPTVSPFGAASPLGLATLATVLHLAVLAGGVRARRLSAEPEMYLIWQVPASDTSDTGSTADKVPSNPIHTYCVGHLALATGMAIIALATWLQIMRINGANGL